MPYIGELKYEGTMYLSEQDARDAILKHNLPEGSCKVVSDILPPDRSSDDLVCFGYRIRVSGEGVGYYFASPDPMDEIHNRILEERAAAPLEGTIFLSREDADAAIEKHDLMQYKPVITVDLLKTGNLGVQFVGYRVHLFQGPNGSDFFTMPEKEM